MFVAAALDVNRSNSLLNYVAGAQTHSKYVKSADSA